MFVFEKMMHIKQKEICFLKNKQKKKEKKIPHVNSNQKRFKFKEQNNV